ncbi:MAG: ABC transporter substrate-binding protein [Clostridia bacterium]
MNKKYISESRYNKTNKIKVSLEKKGVKLKKTKTEIKKRNKLVFKIACCILIAAILTTVIIFSLKEKKDSTYIKGENGDLKPINNSTINIGINKLGEVSPILAQNMYINELNKYIYTYLLTLDKNKNIKYKALSKVDKISSAEYYIFVNNKITYDGSKKITIYDVKNSIEQLKKLGNETPYKDNVENIKQIEVVDQTKLKVTLTKPDPAFIYKLEIPLLPISKYNDIDKIKQDTVPQECGNIYNVYQNDSNIVLDRTNSASKIYPQKLNIVKAENTQELIDKFKNGSLDMFFSTKPDIQNELGRYEYSIKNFSTGESVFMFGNSESENFKIKSARQALAYCIDRSEIKKNVYKNMCMPIDIPYLNLETKYRFDKIVAENLLQADGLEKKGGIYSSKNVTLSYKLLVNKNNQQLYEIAKIIKADVAEIGIRIDIIEADNTSFNTLLNAKAFDLVLMNVNLNENLDISFLDRFMFKNDVLNAADNNLNNSNVQNVQKCLEEKQKTMIEEVSCIGIVTETSNLIYNKEITAFEDVGYINIFNNLQDIHLTNK